MREHCMSADEGIRREEITRLTEQLANMSSGLSDALAQRDENKRQLEEARIALFPILEYGTFRKDLQLGSKISEEAVKAWKERDELKAQNKELREALQAIKDGKDNPEGVDKTLSGGG